LNLATVKVHTFEAGNTSFAIPIGTSAQDLNVTFYDDEDHTLAQWFDIWMNGVILGCMTKAQNATNYSLGAGKGIATLPNAVQPVTVRKLCRDLQAYTYETKYVSYGGKSYTFDMENSLSYLVFPTEAFNFKGNSQSGIETLSMSFQIVGS